MSPMSPRSGLQLLRKHQKMGMILGSSTVEHSAVWNGLTTLTPSTSRLSCMSSEKSTGQPACPAARTTIASQKEIWCSRCKSIAARISDTSGATTSNSANNSTLRLAMRGSRLSYRVTVTKYSWSTLKETTPLLPRRCCATSSMARRRLAGEVLPSA